MIDHQKKVGSKPKRLLELTSPLQAESNTAKVWRQQTYKELRLWSIPITSLIAFTFFFFACGCLILLITARGGAAQPPRTLPLPAFLTAETVTDLSAGITT